MEKFYKSLQKEGFLVRVIRVTGAVGVYDAFDLLSDELLHLHALVPRPKPNIGWKEISGDEYANLLLDTLENKRSYMECDTKVQKILAITNNQ